jgi:hypothetical protein
MIPLLFFSSSVLASCLGAASIVCFPISKEKEEEDKKGGGERRNKRMRVVSSHSKFTLLIFK